MTPSRSRVLVIAPFTHQNGHFVTFPRDVCCGLAASGFEVHLIHARPFRTELDWFGQQVTRTCLKDLVGQSPWLWREVWARLAEWPSAQCLAWLIWRIGRGDQELVLWTDFQGQANVWPLAIARRLGLYRHRTAFFEHHPPYDESGKPHKGLLAWLDPERLRLSGLAMVVLSRAHHESWSMRLGVSPPVERLPYGVWPAALTDTVRTRAREELGIPDDARVLLVFGVQAVKRKHLDTLRAALQGFRPTRPLIVLFTGRSTEAQRHPFADWNEAGVEVRIDGRFVTDAQAAMHFAAADAVWTHYRAFPGASGVLLQCIGYGRIAITSDEGEIGALCREHRLGIVVTEPSHAAVRDGLSRFIDMPRQTQMAWEADIATLAARYAWPVLMGQLMTTLNLPAPAGDKLAEPA